MAGHDAVGDGGASPPRARPAVPDAATALAALAEHLTRVTTASDAGDERLFDAYVGLPAYVAVVSEYLAAAAAAGEAVTEEVRQKLCAGLKEWYAVVSARLWEAVDFAGLADLARPVGEMYLYHWLSRAAALVERLHALGTPGTPEPRDLRCAHHEDAAYAQKLQTVPDIQTRLLASLGRHATPDLPGEAHYAPLRGLASNAPPAVTEALVCAIESFTRLVPYGSKEHVRTYCFLVGMAHFLRGAPLNWVTHMAHLLDTRDKRRCAEVFLWANAKAPSVGLTSLQCRHFLFAFAEGVPHDETHRLVKEAAALDDQHAAELERDVLQGYWYSGDRSVVALMSAQTRSNQYTFKLSDDASDDHAVVDMNADPLGGGTRTGDAGDWWVNLGPVNTVLALQTAERRSAGRLAGYDAVLLQSNMVRQSMMTKNLIIINREVRAEPSILHLTKDAASAESFGLYAGRLLAQPLASAPSSDIQRVITDVFAEAPFKTAAVRQELLDVIARRVGVRNAHPETLLKVLARLELPNTNALAQLSERDPNLNMVGVIGRILTCIDDKREREPFKHVVDVRVLLPLIKAAVKEHPDLRNDDPLSVLTALTLVNRNEFDGMWAWTGGVPHADETDSLQMVYPNAFTVTGQHIALHHPVFAGASVERIRYGDDTLHIVVHMHDPDSIGAPRTVEICLVADPNDVTAAGGYWDCGGVVRACSFSRHNIATPKPGWGVSAYGHFFNAMRDMIQSWQSADFLQTQRAASAVGQRYRDHARTLICSIFPPNVPQLSTKAETTRPFERVLCVQPPGLWWWMVQQLLSSWAPRDYANLDAWVLPPYPQAPADADALAQDLQRDLSTLTGIRKNAADVLIKGYQTKRMSLQYTGVVSHVASRIPPRKALVTRLLAAYPALSTLTQTIDNESRSLHKRLQEERISHRDLSQCVEKRAVHEDNGVVFPSDLGRDQFQKPNRDLERIRAVYLELVKDWGLTENGAERRVIDELISHSMTEELKRLKETAEAWKGRLKKFFTHTHVIRSRVFKAHFKRANAGVRTFDNLQGCYDNTCKALRSLSLDATVAGGLAGLPPAEEISESYRQQEMQLLAEDIGVDAAVVRALLMGAAPLRRAVHALQSFRQLVVDPPPEMVLRRDFFVSDEERGVLLQRDVDDVLLRDAEAKVQQIRDITCGCDLRVFEIIHTMLACGALVKFTRDYPSAQDAGLADVLSNTRDIQHASFQTFLNVAGFVNPFVAASQEHCNLFYAEKERLEQAAGGGKMAPSEAAKESRLRLCINNRTSDDPAAQGAGFWELLGKTLTEDCPVAIVQSNLEKMAGADQIELLKKMITEQHTATDRMVDECRTIAGIVPPGARDGGRDAGMSPVPTAAATMIVDLPVTGSPSLECHIAGSVKTTAAYEDLVYRATLQRSISPEGSRTHTDLGAFLEQAENSLQVYDAACRLFTEGHIEFRSRKLTFKHDKSDESMQCMRALQGHWSALEAAGGSLLGKACEEFKYLSCLTSAELVRMVDLLRRASAHGEEASADDALLSAPWRQGRTRSADIPAPADLQLRDAALTQVLAVKKPTAAAHTGGRKIIVRDCREATGDYKNVLWTYRRHDGAVLAPVAQGWAVYLPHPGHDGHLVRKRPCLASTYEHAGRLHPWQMDQWYEAEPAKDGGAHGALLSQPSKTRVQIERKYVSPPQWAEERQSDKTRHLTVRTHEQLPALATNVVGDMLYVGRVERGSIWEARGFEEGMRVCSVQVYVDPMHITDPDAPPSELQEALTMARKVRQEGYLNFVVGVDSAWIWDATSKCKSLNIDWSGRSITKQSGAIAVEDLSFATCAAPGVGASWRVRFSGEVDDVMVGLVKDDFAAGDTTRGDAAAENGYWYRRDGTLCHGATREFNSQGAFKAGDIVTVAHTSDAVEFYLNDVRVGRVPHAGEGSLRPCVGLKRVHAAATLIQGTPTHEVLEWNTSRTPDMPEGQDTWGVNIDGPRLTKTRESNKGIVAAVGNTVFRGPGPHTFRIRVAKNTAQVRASTQADNLLERLKDIHIGVGTPAAARTHKCNTKTDLFALTVNVEGSVFNAQGVLDNSTRPKPGVKINAAEHLDFTLVFTVELGDRKSIQVVRQGRDATGRKTREVQLVNTNDFSTPLEIEGALCPLVWFEGDCSDLVVELKPRPDTEVEYSSPSAVIKGSRGGIADGLYKEWLPVFTRTADSLYNMFYWNRRWCIADPADRPLAWSGETATPETIGKRPLKWTVVDPFEATPHAVEIKSLHGVDGVLTRSATKRGGKVCYANDTLDLYWCDAYSSWLVAPTGSANTDTDATAYMRSMCACDAPHHAGTWAVGNGREWVQTCTAAVKACAPQRTAVAAVCVQASVLTEEVAKSGAVAGMMPDELAAWHIIKRATGVHCTVPELRRALIKTVQRGDNSGLYLDLDAWESQKHAQEDIADAAKRQLTCIGELLQGLATDASPDVLSARNFDPRTPWYGALQGKALKERIVDASKLKVSDRKLFALSLFEGDLRPYHMLDCTPDMPVEDVRTFLSLYQRSTAGRFVVFGMQLLRSEAQSEIRAVLDAEGDIRRDAATGFARGARDLYAVVTGGDAVEGAVESLDATCCNMQWRRLTCEKVRKLNKFKSITYFLQAEGTGKSFAIEKQWKDSGFTPTRLDLDSTTRSMDAVCQRLVTPFLQERGLLVVHVGHDTEPALVNYVLDHLMFMGSVASHTGLLASVPDSGWHLVVEFQTPPAREARHVVNPAWRTRQGHSDITLLATWDLGKEGTLEQYDVTQHSDNGRAEHALWFIRQYGLLPKWDHWSWDDDEQFLRTLTIGHLLHSFDRPPREDELQRATARAMTRALKFATKKVNRYIAPASAKDRKAQNKERHAVVARSIIHEMHYFITTDSSMTDHFHAQVDLEKLRKLKYCLLSGELPSLLKSVIADYQAHLTIIYRVPQQEATQALIDMDVPLHYLLTMLLYEMGIDTKVSTLCLANKNYALTPDFLQKIFQLNNHIGLNDPIVLQGPSGTGKTYAVQILSDLLHLPSTTVDGGQIDITRLIPEFCRISSEVRNLLFQTTGDIKKNDELIISSALHRQNPLLGIKDCLNILTDSTADTETAMGIIRDVLVQHLGPRLNDVDTHPELVDMVREKPDFAWDKLREAKDAKEIKRHVVSILECLGKYLPTQPLQSELLSLVGAALRSQKMKDLAGSMYAEIVGILSKRHIHDALQLWARTILSPDHLGRPGQFKGELLCNAVKNRISELLTSSAMFDVPPELEFKLADTGTLSHPTTGDELADIMAQAVELQPIRANCFVLMRYDLTPDMLFEELLPSFRRAVSAPKVKFMVMIDEMNATHMLGLLKRLVVDRYWDKWADAEPHLEGRIPDNIAFIGAVNPSKKDAILEGRTDFDGAVGNGDADANEPGSPDGHHDTVAELGFDVTPMPPALNEHIVPWRQLERKRMEDFISRLVRQNRCVYDGSLNEQSLKTLVALLVKAHTFAQRECQNKRSTVSQRDIHRTMKTFEFFYKHGVDFCVRGSAHRAEADQVALSSMILGVAFSYYFRFPSQERARLARLLDGLLDAEGLRRVPFAQVVDNAVEYFCSSEHMKFPDAVYAHKALKENLFVQMVCFDLRLSVILEGPPGTSKTLSNNIIRDNMTGSGPFWKNLCHIADICRYQGSSQSSADEIRKRCKEAYDKQRESDAAGMRKKRTLLFVDEAGLVKSDSDDRKWALKVLHFYLEGANLAAVLMTNQTLDPAIGNRCVVVYMGKPEPDELTNMCAGILHRQGLRGLDPRAQVIVDRCCKAFHSLVPPMDEKEELVGIASDEKTRYRWWYGLRDLFHMMRYIRRNRTPPADGADEHNTLLNIHPELLARALQRNFNGPKQFFDEVLRVFGACVSEGSGDIGGEAAAEGGPVPFSRDDLRQHLMLNLDVIIDSIEDNNRATANASGKNLNDMWVRFKLVVDNSDDGSLLQLLRQENLNIPHFKDMRVLRLSSLAKGDSAKKKLMPVTVVSQIAAAMEAGQTVWLTNTREIDACLFELFNQNFVVANSGEVNHFAALAIGASLEYRRVHPNFQCIVHVMKKDLAHMGELLPSPFLNRLEKFSVSVEDVLAWVCKGREGGPHTALRARLDAFDKALSLKRGRPLFSTSPKETVASLILESANMEAPPAVDPRIAADPALAAFVDHTDEELPEHWRRTSLRLLQLFQLDHMLLAQDVLLDSANGYLRAYFCDLEPWSLRAYLRSLVDRPAGAPVVKSVVYAPSNTEFMSLFDEVAHTAFIGIDTLAESERGKEQLRESVQRFMADGDLRVFGVVVTPELLGSSEVREVQWLLDEHLADEKVTRGETNKAVVILQSFPQGGFKAQAAAAAAPSGYVRGPATGFTPLFGTGWDQRYIDASGDRPDLDMKRYINEAVVGPGHCDNRVFLASADAAQKDAEIKSRMPSALSSLFFVQTGQGWAPVPDDDPAAAIYDLNRPFDEQLRVAGEALSNCEKLVQIFGELCAASVPTKAELIRMTKDLAGVEGTSSLPQRLVEEEDRVFVKLLAFALQLLLDDRNVSRILTAAREKDEKMIVFVDSLMAMALQIESNRTTFEYLRHVRLDAHRELSVKALMPEVPGSLFLMDQLVIPPSAVDARVEARTLQEEHDHSDYDRPTITGRIVRLVHEKGYVLDFFKDCVRSRMSNINDRTRMEQCLSWVFEMVRGLHKSEFGADVAETVYSVHALCCVKGAAIDEYILTWLPLVNIGLQVRVQPWSGRPDEAWVAHEQCPELLIQSFLSGAMECAEFMVACSCLLHRATPEWIAQSRYLPCLMVVGALLRGEEDACDRQQVVTSATKFIEACKGVMAAPRVASGEPHLPLDLAELRVLLASLSPKRVQKVALVLLDLHGYLPARDDLPRVLIDHVATGQLTRAMAARIVGRMIEVRQTDPSNPISDDVLVYLAHLAYHAASAQAQAPPLTADAVYLPPGRADEAAVSNVPLHRNAVYLALYDSVYEICIGDDAQEVCGGKATSTCVLLACRINALAALQEMLAAGEAAQAGHAICSAVRAAVEVAFLQALAVAFQPPPTARKSEWAPSLMESGAFDNVKSLSRGLMSPEGFTLPPKNSPAFTALLAKPPCDTAEYNTLVFLSTLERGVSSTVLGMGMKATMEYLQCQVERTDDSVGPLVTTCGPWIEFKCHSAKTLDASPGDLPFLYDQTDPVYPAYVQLNNAWKEYDDPRAVKGTTPLIIEAVCATIDMLKRQYALEEVRLLVLYYAAKRYFLQRHPMFCANEMCSALAGPLGLDKKQQRFFKLMLCPSQGDIHEVVWSRALQSALGERGLWTEMVVTTAAVAAARPQTLLWSLVLDIDQQQNYFLPGDKTGNAVVLGGGYKLDCVTQLDPSGQLFSFATNQPVLSHGSCYLLWGVMFGAFAMQLGMFKETYNTFARWVISPELQMKGMPKDEVSAPAEYLVERFVERSMAYHFHMARNTGLNQDDAQNMYSNLIYKFHTAPQGSPLRRMTNKDRQLALQVEFELEKIWRSRTGTGQQQPAPAAPRATAEDAADDTAMVGTQGGDAKSQLKLAMVLAGFPARLQLLKRVGSVTTALKCLSGYEFEGQVEAFPKLLSMALMERDKLALLAPLLIEVYHFAIAAHKYLSGTLPSNADSSDGRTAYRSILELFDERCHIAHATRLREQLASIKRKWNDYRNKVGPIDFECAAGGINVEMDLHDPQVGAAGLPDTLDFWVHMSDTSVDEDHRNLAQAAVFSLTSQYNECQKIISAYTRIPLEPVHPMMLNPAKPDLLLTEQSDLERKCRSYVADDGAIDWKGIENEISFGSGLIIPPMMSAVLPEFRWSDVVNAKAEEVQQKAREQLATALPRHGRPLTEVQRVRLQDVTHRLTEDQSITFLSWLSDTMAGDMAKDGEDAAAAGAPPPPSAVVEHVRKPAPRGNLWSAMMQNRSLAAKKAWFKWDPQLQEFFTYDLLVENLGEVLQFFLARIVQAAQMPHGHVGEEYLAPVPEEAAAVVDAHFVSEEREKALDDIEGILLVLQQCLAGRPPTGDPLAPRMWSLLEYVGDIDESIVHALFGPLSFRHAGTLVAFLTDLQRRLSSTDRRSWIETEGNFVE